MPMLLVQTNVQVDRLPADVSAELTQQVSDLLAKPIQKIFVSVSHVPNLTFQGTTEPTALVELKSIGFADKPKVVAALTKFFYTRCNIPTARVGITLVDLNPAFVGIGGNALG